MGRTKSAEKESDLVLELADLHPAQKDILIKKNRFNVVCCGRRWGKTVMAYNLMCHHVSEGHKVGYFTPDYKMLQEVFEKLTSELKSIVKSKDAQLKRVTFKNGASVDFWTLDNKDCGRSRSYHLAIIDEAAMCPRLKEIWDAAIRPTLSDFQGSAWFFSTPKAKNDFYDLYQRSQTNNNWSSFSAPTSSNPYILKEEIEDAKNDLPLLIYTQEFEATFVDYIGEVFGNFESCILKKEITEEDRQKDLYLGLDLALSKDYAVLVGINSEGTQVLLKYWTKLTVAELLDKIIEILNQYPGNIIGGYVDSTGLGKPIVEEITKANLPFTPYFFSNTSKQAIISNLILQFQNNKIKIQEDKEQIKELLNFERKETATGLLTYSGIGAHDDIVIALALACYYRKSKENKQVYRRSNYSLSL